MLGVGSPLLARHRFDVAIVDEAGQMTLPAAIAPLLAARSFVLVRKPLSSSAPPPRDQFSSRVAPSRRGTARMEVLFVKHASYLVGGMTRCTSSGRRWGTTISCRRW